ncbi:MAG: hypothetical protein ACRDWT_01695, partial [Jatrophihabitantaceae bacterium]
MTTMTAHRWQHRTLITVAVAALSVLTACSSAPRATTTSADPATPTGTIHEAAAHVGDLTITGGYIPQPASPD